MIEKKICYHPNSKRILSIILQNMITEKKVAGRRDVLNDIALTLSKNASYLKENGLRGKLKVSLFLFQYARKYDKHYYRDLAFDILDYAINKELLLEIQMSKLGVLNGVCGIGLFIMSMLREQYFDTDLGEISVIIDKQVYTEIEPLTRTSTPTNLTDLLSILAYLKYRNAYSGFEKEFDQLLNQESTLLTEITINHLLSTHVYDKGFLEVVRQMIAEISSFGDSQGLARIRESIQLAGERSTRSRPRARSKTARQILSLYRRSSHPNWSRNVDFNAILADILKDQKNVAVTFGHLTNLGLLILSENNALMKLFWGFWMLEFHDTTTDTI